MAKNLEQIKFGTNEYVCTWNIFENISFCENKMEDDFKLFLFSLSYSVFNNRNYNRGYVKLPRIISLKRHVS